MPLRKAEVRPLNKFWLNIVQGGGIKCPIKDVHGGFIVIDVVNPPEEFRMRLQAWIAHTKTWGGGSFYPWRVMGANRNGKVIPIFPPASRIVRRVTQLVKLPGESAKSFAYNTLKHPRKGD